MQYVRKNSNCGYWKYHVPAGVGSPVSDQAGVVRYTQYG